MIYNNKQKMIIENAYNHIYHGNEQVYQFSGPAGSGKTTVIKGLIEKIGIPLERIAIMTFIGQAAIVMRTKGLYNAKTIHSRLYHLVDKILVDSNGNVIMNTTYNKPEVELIFEPDPHALDDVDYCIIDEGGTVPDYMRPTIESYGKPIIVAGDHNQLPPVKSKPAFIYPGTGHIDYLDEIMRQGKDSEILYIADLVCKGVPLNAGLYGNVLVIEEKDLTDDMIKASQIIICGKNKTRDKFNNHIRKDILHINNTLPMFGEKIICRKNNWNIEVSGISLANGLIGQVIRPPMVDDFNGKEFFIDFKPDLLDTYFAHLNCDYKYFTANAEDRNFLKSDPYSQGEKFEYAYAITTHLSQGAEYNNGIYFQEYLNPSIQNNLNYTGITRFRDFAIYVIPNRRRYF